MIMHRGSVRIPRLSMADPAMTLIQLCLSGIASMTDPVAIFRKV